MSKSYTASGNKAMVYSYSAQDIIMDPSKYHDKNVVSNSSLVCQFPSTVVKLH